MTADSTPRPPHVVTIAEHTVFDAVCVTCPWVSGGHVQREWAEHVQEQHEKGHSVVANEEEGDRG